MTAPKKSTLQGLHYHSIDTIMYGMMNYMQWQLRHEVGSQASLEAYLQEYASWDRSSYFSIMPMEKLEIGGSVFSWESPRSSSFLENNRARTLFFPASRKNSDRAPTLIILHALMSATDLGYRRIAARMNHQGWNVLFPHLPFHYSRKPQHHANGALAITADLIRTAETVRQAVQEIRQLMVWLQDLGSRRIGLLATSYGGWIASLLLALEPIDFAILLQPIINLGRATFESPLARVMGSLLQANGITRKHLERHAHLTEPSHSLPLTSPKRITIIGGKYDLIAPPEHLKIFSSNWKAHYEEVHQGHFGYKAMQKALVIMEQFLGSHSN
ncbi:MAG: alpha/beta hydrolase family protein [Chthoniobacterales bacterium]